MKRILLSVVGVAFAGPLFAALKLGVPFADGMVLQREMKVPVWGTADAGAEVSVSFAGQSVRTTAGTNGAWRVDLEPLVASKEGRDLVVTEFSPGNQAIKQSNNQTILHDVLVGEVWYCSGQSNTQLPLRGTNVRFRDRNGALIAQMTDKPCVRYVKAVCEEPKYSVTPEIPPRYDVVWKKFNRKNLMPLNGFSAIGVYFALELHSSLDVPVGIVGSYHGGTNIDAWTPTCGTASRPDLKDVLDRPLFATKEAWDAAPKEMRLSPFNGLNQQRSVLWNSMVAAWCPMAMRGFIWYQGCHNAKEPERYCSKMHALYDGWSQMFENPGLKLCFVQLAPWGEGTIPFIQEAQARFAAEERNASMAVINDVGNLNDIHPRDKELVVKRLAIHALKEAYGWNVRADSPTLAKWEVKDGKFVLDFDHAEGFYVYYDSRDPEARVKELGFEVCGTNGVWKVAGIDNFVGSRTRQGKPTSLPVVRGSRLVVSSPEVPEPVKLRYLHSHPWTGRLYSDVDLPLGAFHVGD